MPQISIIIPVYNAQKTLVQCLQSIFNQSFKNFEIIAINDGSTDKSQKILTQYQNKITIVNQLNQGAAKARNVGAKLARGEYIIFCDADIILKPKTLETMFKNLAKKPKISYAYSSFRFGFKIFKLWPFSAKRLKQMPYIHTTSLIRAKDFPGFDKNLKRFQDWDLWLTILERGKRGIYIPEVLFTAKSGGTMSTWLPKSFYRLFPKNKKVKEYQAAEKIIKAKHKL